jgi:hypothetical protein
MMLRSVEFFSTQKINNPRGSRAGRSGLMEVVSLSAPRIARLLDCGAYATRNTSVFLREEPSNSPVKRVIRLALSSGLALGVNGSV